jgi:hypothetical protein
MSLRPKIAIEDHEFSVNSFSLLRCEKRPTAGRQPPATIPIANRQNGCPTLAAGAGRLHAVLGTAGGASALPTHLNPIYEALVDL